MAARHDIATMRIPRTTLDIILAMVGAIGVALLTTVLVTALVHNSLVQRISVGASYLGSPLAMWLWLRDDPDVSLELKSFRNLVVIEFIVFGALGLVIGLSAVVAPFN